MTSSGKSYVKPKSLNELDKKLLSMGIEINISDGNDKDTSLPNDEIYFDINYTDPSALNHEIGYARYVRGIEPMISIKNPLQNGSPSEQYYNLNYIDITEKGKGYGMILMYYSIEYIFDRYKHVIEQIQLDDDSDYGTCFDTNKRAKSIYTQLGFHVSESVRREINTGKQTPKNKVCGPERFLTSKMFKYKNHKFKGWATIKKTIIRKLKLGQPPQRRSTRKSSTRKNK